MFLAQSKNKPLTIDMSHTFFSFFKKQNCIYIDSAVDAEELAGLFIELFQVFSVPVEIWCDEQVRPQVYTVSVRQTYKNKGFNKGLLQLLSRITLRLSC